ncbi:GatB/YqeY domain-containing protein [Desulfoluna sp.]|uniref:GatB/YqeY domain-containing protein n=1 Tax=Desulfoluna sp. TaxID=2045199 RepID=UPI002623DD02|nr:GatB/YqeY domain-containing protein [Desulfoluna sp.]
MVDNEKSPYGWSEGTDVSLYNKIKQDLKTAMKTKDSAARDTFRLIMGEYPKLTVAMTLESGKKTTRVKTPDEITDEDLQNIIRGLAKSEKVVLDIKGETTSDYVELLQSYLPQMASKEEIKAWIDAQIDFSSVKSPMQAMGQVMKHFGKLADGNLVKEILKEMG